MKNFINFIKLFELKTNLIVDDNIMLFNPYLNNINLFDIKNRRFMYNNKTKEFLLGNENLKIHFSSHAEEWGNSNAKGNFDDSLRGWVGTSKTGKYKNGVIHFAPPAKDEYLNINFNSIFNLLDIFKNFGANEKTILIGFGDKHKQKLGDILKF